MGKSKSAKGQARPKPNTSGVLAPLTKTPLDAPRADDAKTASFARFFAQATSFSGPLPPPEVLAQYNAAVPDAAERILKMAEQQAAHRQDLEKKVVHADIQKSYLGLGVYGILTFTGIVCGSVVASNGQIGWGAAAFGTPIGVGAVLYYVGLRFRKKERAEKNEALQKSIL